jgi:hypothetical protein
MTVKPHYSRVNITLAVGPQRPAGAVFTRE